MRIFDLKQQQIGQIARLSATCSSPSATRGDFEVWIEMPAQYVPTQLSGDPFLAAFLIACMYSQENLQIEAPVSKKLFDSLTTIQQLMSGWFPEFSAIEVTASEIHDPIPKTIPENSALFFSGGVDSWHSLLRNRKEITHLILVLGFDIKFSQTGIWDQTRQLAQNVADHFQLELLVIRTNLKRRVVMSKSSCRWGRKFQGQFLDYVYGSFLSALGLTMQVHIQRLTIATGLDKNYLIPHGSHPDLDPLWSTENMQVIHDGIEDSRFIKIRDYIINEPLALKQLRVCQDYQPHRINCCACEKCLRTMIALQICGKLKQSPAFPDALSIRRVKQLYLPRGKILDDFYIDLAHHAHHQGQHALANAIEIALGQKRSLHHLWSSIHQRFGSRLISSAPKRHRAKLKRLIGPATRLHGNQD